MVRAWLACVTVCGLISCGKPEKGPVAFRIENGFTISEVAREPLISDPVDLEFTETGDALVLEMPGYPFEDRQSRIVLLKDKNGDGIFDEQSLFADSLQMASSLLLYGEGVLVAAPPYLLYLKDLNHDNRADEVDTLMGGFSTGNLQHNYNGLTYGFDNWIYAANGGNSGKPFWWGDTTTVMDLRGQDFRFNPEKRTMERIGESSGGFGLAMDDYGRIFETHNLTHVSQLVFPDRYINNVPLLPENSLLNISDHEEDGLARIYPIGEQETRVNHPEQSGYFSGSCGIAYYSSGALGPDFDNTVWVNDVVLNLAHVDDVKPNGAALVAKRKLANRDFLASTDRSFRPVNLTVGPDGALYLVDMYRKVIEHPEWIPDEIEKKLDLEAGKDKGRIYRITRAATTPVRFDAAQWSTTEGLVASLGAQNQWMRKTAHRVLMSRTLSDTQYASLQKLLGDSSPMARLHALWILHNKGKLTVAGLSAALTDSVSGIRENALIIAESYFGNNDELIAKVLNVLQDGDQRVRMQAALTLSALPGAASQSAQKEIINQVVACAEKPMDTWNVAALSLASKRDPSAVFARMIALASPPAGLLSSLALQCGKSELDVNLVLDNLDRSQINNATRQKIIRSLAKNLEANLKGKQALTSIQKLEKTKDASVISALAIVRNKLHLPLSPEFLTQSKEALRVAADREVSDSIRLKQMTLIDLLPFSEKSDVLFQCLQNTEPLNVQEEALRQLSKFDDRRIGTWLVAHWAELGPFARRSASDLLLYNPVHHDALLTGLENGKINIGEMNFDLERRRTLLWWTDDENTRRRAKALFSDEGVNTRAEAIAKMKDALTLHGSGEKGALVFNSICAACHRYGNVGNDVGPVLTEISRKSKELLLHDILDPNAAVNTQYINHKLETRDGKIHVGIVDSETNAVITLKKMGGEQITISKTEVKTFSSLGTSLMMEGLENSMTPQELADLLAFLKGQD